MYIQLMFAVLLAALQTVERIKGVGSRCLGGRQSGHPDR